MKKLVMALVILTSAMASSAWAGSGDNEITGALGFDEGAVNLGVEYEHRGDVPGWGGYFLYQAEHDISGATDVNQVIAIGGEAKIHLLDNNKIDAFLAPGAGLVMVKKVIDKSNGGTTDTTDIGPSLRIGVLFPLSPTVKLGLSHTEVWSWFDQNAPKYVSFYQAAIAFDF